MKRLVIRNQEQLAAALNRAEELAGCAEGSDEALECLVIADAVQLYREALIVIAGVGRKARMQPKDDSLDLTRQEL